MQLKLNAALDLVTCATSSTTFPYQRSQTITFVAVLSILVSIVLQIILNQSNPKEPQKTS